MTTLSSKGQVVMPRLVRSKLHLAPGTKLLCEIQGDSVILTLEHPVRPIREHVIDALTGLRVRIQAGFERDAPSAMETSLQNLGLGCLFMRAAGAASQDHSYRYGLLLRGH
jgi:AbrB family looped-hinge helix DNA binding protein